MDELFFGEVIHRYTRAQAIEDGVLVDVTEMAREAGFRVPVAITQAVHADISDIPEGEGWQSYDGRLWDVLWMGYFAIKSGRLDVERNTYDLYMNRGEKQVYMKNGKVDRSAPDTPYRLKMHSGPGDEGEHVITIMRPEED